MVTRDEGSSQTGRPVPFAVFAGAPQAPSAWRSAISALTRVPEPEAVAALIEPARLNAAQAARALATATRLTGTLRHSRRETTRRGLVQDLMNEFSLSSQEGVALMCLAEALLRIPDDATRDELIRDKLSGGNWRAHLGNSVSPFVNAATWGLVVTGKLVSTHTESGLGAALTRMILRSGEPVIRKAVDLCMRLLGEQFVVGETIEQALANSVQREAQGFRHSFDMLGEAAVTAEDARRYLAAYQHAIETIGTSVAGRSVLQGPGISIKLSALHPRYSRAQRGSVMSELYPRLRELAASARLAGIGLNIDAEESERLDLSLDLFERLCAEPALAGFDGLGFVVQAYQKRCPAVIDFLIDLARRTRHRLMVRLVKGAYWDSEIKRAQIDGLADYPVYTRKVHTDLAYLACARRLLEVPDAIYPQFATHNAQTLASILEMAGGQYDLHRYEFQCLHGMGEPLYEQLVGNADDHGKIGAACRIYAPVGPHETLLAYLVRRLLENGANTSFVHRIADTSIPIEALVTDPVVEVERAGQAAGRLGLPHPRVPLPARLHGEERLNSQGIDLSNEQVLMELSARLMAQGAIEGLARATVGPDGQSVRADLDARAGQPVVSPADRRDAIGRVIEAGAAEIEGALARAAAFAPAWQATPASQRAMALELAAQQMQEDMVPLIALLVREAGKTVPNAIGEIREAIDFLRYYAAQAHTTLAMPGARALGPVVCISPWNFPLAIFLGQVAAALAAGNVVLAKPAEQTPLIAAEAVRRLHAAGVPVAAVQLVPGAGETVGAALVADARIRGVMFTGSTTVARLLQRSLAGRVDEAGHPLVLIAETGGQNAMIVDSSALTEQVVADVMTSAFDSAGQRCSALRVLCVQREVADRVLRMLEGAMAQAVIGHPDRLATDIGPVIDDAAAANVLEHVERMRAGGHRIFCARPPRSLAGPLPHGHFIAPTLIEIASIEEIGGEIFGPVLHVLRYDREQLDALLEAITATGFGLTLGLHTRIDETIDRVLARSHVGNVYVNRNMIGAVVGVQPFGGEGLSGTGPKAGGPLYAPRLLAVRPVTLLHAALARLTPRADDEVAVRRTTLLDPLVQYLAWLRQGMSLAHAALPESSLALAAQLATLTPAGNEYLLTGPTGERNLYQLVARKATLVVAPDAADRLMALAVVLAAGGTAVFEHTPALERWRASLPPAVRPRVRLVAAWQAADFDVLVVLDQPGARMQWSHRLAERSGPIIGLVGLASGDHEGLVTRLDQLLLERSVSINTAAAGGNASLMTLD